ncbi:integrase catalytic domain-containing protein [Trichonephila clavipes]|nr:integrase catalytic domain-containing protein [Trichonephila clavipes]
MCAGTQLVQSCIQEQYWIIGARDVIRHLIRKCCKVRASITNQIMSDLPSSRISPAPAFMRCGVDYTGPFQIKTIKGRGSKSFKAYTALFVCFTTRAIHLELVTDLSADAFIAALKRFVSRRGKYSDLYSDRGSNFVGAKCKLMEFENLAKSDNYNQNVSKFLTDNGIKGHPNVPGAPHMGGLWEAGIKSTEYHLKRVVGETKLTYEEFETFLTQIQSCLNSRPLTPISNDPNDLSALTPGHFIIGKELTSIPEPNYIDPNSSYLTRWQQIQKLVQQELGWSYELPFKEERKWSRFIDYLAALNNISIDRCIVDHRAESIELHASSDASEKAYGSSIYLKSISTLGEVKDDKGVLRVGGKERWLEKASIPYSQKHPTILAKKSKLSKI